MHRPRTIRALFAKQVPPPPAAPVWDETVITHDQQGMGFTTVKALALLEAYAAPPGGEPLDEYRRRWV
ncbi:MAG: hypothetical protein QOK36_2808 [Gaiellales bacterium]|jgi:hypothetical protein|nr:hypothetical protein [Gaiellales bacterium]